MESLKPAKKYSNSFKQEAVRLLIEGNHSQASVAKELGVTITSLRSWKKRLANEAGTTHLPTYEEELKRLKQENARLREERDILKKVVGIVSRE